MQCIKPEGIGRIALYPMWTFLSTIENISVTGWLLGQIGCLSNFLDASLSIGSFEVWALFGFIEGCFLPMGTYIVLIIGFSRFDVILYLFLPFVSTMKHSTAEREKLRGFTAHATKVWDVDRCNMQKTNSSVESWAATREDFG